MAAPEVQLARAVRSGLEETFHSGAVGVIDRDGNEIVSLGEVDRPFFLRSAAKPFQAMLAMEAGAELGSEQLAVACSSHGGTPIQVAYVRQILEEAGLDEGALRCPPAWPLDLGARQRLHAEGIGAPRSIFHNCSGKHAALLSACVAAGWSTHDYLDPAHPLQQRIVEEVGALTGVAPEPVGVDGCGAPVLRGTVRGLARAFSRLATDRRYREAWDAMHRYSFLTAGPGRAEAELARWANVAAKVGARGCLGVSVAGGVGLGVKCWDGDPQAAAVAAIEVLRRLGVVTSFMEEPLRPFSHPAVLGRGEPVGQLEPVLE